MESQSSNGGLWSRMWAKPQQKWLLGVPLGGILLFAAGVIGAGVFNQFVTWTNTEGFCISCHEMRDTVYQEYQKTTHFSNPSGVRAICSDCHVPKNFWPKIWRKFKASNELIHKALGTIDTPEKFEAKREELAERVWARMRETDSQECRNCHAQEQMNLEKQEKRAANRHSAERRAAKGETCIDCHDGIAHKLPKVTKK